MPILLDLDQKAPTHGSAALQVPEPQVRHQERQLQQQSSNQLEHAANSDNTSTKVGQESEESDLGLREEFYKLQEHER